MLVCRDFQLHSGAQIGADEHQHVITGWLVGSSFHRVVLSASCVGCGQLLCATPHIDADHEHPNRPGKRGGLGITLNARIPSRNFAPPVSVDAMPLATPNQPNHAEYFGLFAIARPNSISGSPKSSGNQMKNRPVCINLTE